MKRSFSNHHEVAHVWAAQTQSEGHGSRMLFEGPSIYSYGRHFEIARIVKPGIVLFTTRGYSVSTSKHISITRRAASHMKIFEVPSMTDHRTNAEHYAKLLTDDLYKITRMRKNAEFWLGEWKAKVTEAADYVKLFKAEMSAAHYGAIMAIYKKRENPLSKDLLAKFKARALVERAAAKEERARKATQAAERLAEEAAELEAWSAGGPLGQFFYKLPTRLRIKDNEIQTSRGATIPLIEARKFWHVLEAKGSIEGMRIGHYTVTGMRETDLIVGCHTIPMTEVQRMAVALHLA